MTETPEQLHSIYRNQTGLDVRYSMHHYYVWQVFSHAGFTGADLATVCRYLHREIRSGKSKFTPATFKFRNLIEDLPRFADELAVAKATMRIPVPTDKQSVMRSTGRTEVNHTAAKSVAQVLERKKLADMLHTWKEENK